MNLNQAIQLEMMAAGVEGTTSADVQGIPKIVGKVVRRQVPAGYTKMSSSKKRKKRKTKWSDGSDKVDEWATEQGPGDRFQQLDNVIQQANQDKFWPIEVDPQLYQQKKPGTKKKRKRKKNQNGKVL